MSKRLLVPFIFIFNFSANAYWQQKLNYTINVELIDSKHTLKAYEKVTYVNNSPDTLKEMYFHLWPNAYQAGTPLDKQLQEDGNTKLYFGDDKYIGSFIIAFTCNIFPTPLIINTIIDYIIFFIRKCRRQFVIVTITIIIITIIIIISIISIIIIF